MVIISIIRNKLVRIKTEPSRLFSFLSSSVWRPVSDRDGTSELVVDQVYVYRSINTLCHVLVNTCCLVFGYVTIFRINKFVENHVNNHAFKFKTHVENKLAHTNKLTISTVENRIFLSPEFISNNYL